MIKIICKNSLQEQLLIEELKRRGSDVTVIKNKIGITCKSKFQECLLSEELKRRNGIQLNEEDRRTRIDCIEDGIAEDFYFYKAIEKFITDHRPRLNNIINDFEAEFESTGGNQTAHDYESQSFFTIEKDASDQDIDELVSLLKTNSKQLEKYLDENGIIDCNFVESAEIGIDADGIIKESDDGDEEYDASAKNRYVVLPISVNIVFVDEDEDEYE